MSEQSKQVIMSSVKERVATLQAQRSESSHTLYDIKVWRGIGEGMFYSLVISVNIYLLILSDWSVDSYVKDRTGNC